jgi:hypothetical protein
MTLALILILVILFVFLGIYYYKKNHNKEPYSPYKILNMNGGEDRWKCGSCTQYGSVFDYQKQKSDRTYGVPNGCQKIF